MTLPPLRERPEDVRPIAQHFLDGSAYGRKRLSAGAFECLEAYTWPGNVRELEHAIERAVILAAGDEITPEDLPPEIRGGGGAMPPALTAGSLEEIERQHIISTLRQVAGHRGKAAALLRIDPKTLYRKIIGYGITSEMFGN